MQFAANAVQVATAISKTERRNRSPKHTFQIRQKPWDIQPFLIAPVIPGETLTRGLMQARAVSQPIKNPLIGWWLEYYYFYVKLRDLDVRDDLVEMMLDPSKDMSSINVAAASASTYHAAATPDYVAACLKRVTEEYFRDEGETYAGPGIVDGMPLAKALPKQSNWMDSVATSADLEARADNDLQNPNHGAIEGLDQYQEAYDRMRAMRMVDMTFDEWLGTFGVNVRKDEQQHIPELIRYHREWTYPSNTVDPTTGVPSSAASWSVSDRLDKDRFFREPGFIFGVSVARPKIYLSGQKGAAANMLNTAASWMPALLGDAPWTSLREFAGASGPLGGIGASPGDYWVDMRDLFLYGDQFLNFATTETDAGIVALPKAGMAKSYVDNTDRNGLFVTAAANTIRQDGVIDLTIKGPPMTTVDQT